MPTLRIEPWGRSVEVPEGAYLLDALESLGADVPFCCRAGRCAADPVRVLDGADRLSPPLGMERFSIERMASEGEPDCRMACSARVEGDVTIDVSLILPGAAKAA